MRTFTYQYIDQPLEKLINFSDFHLYENILVQIFCGQNKKILQKLSREIKKLIPNAQCIGTTTDGEINQDQISTQQTVISISIFEQTQIKSALVNSSNSFQNGIDLANALITENTKLMILFTDGTSSNGEAFLKGIESVNPNVIISGGMAGDNGQFSQTYILEGESLLTQGAVGVSLNSDILHIHNDFSFNWSPIGVEHIIDRVEDNRVYSIDNMSPVDFYAKYLGAEVAKALPATGIEFPLIVEKNGIKIARAVIAKHEDNSLVFAGNLSCGDRVRLGFGNAELIMKESLESFDNIYKYPVETFFIYSCMARRRYMPGFIQMEIKPFAKTATTAGFFTYGEFFHHKNHNELLNQTLTVVALSESTYEKTFPKHTSLSGLSKEHSDYATTIKALTHLIELSTQDYEKQTKKLEREKQYSQQLLESQKVFLRHAIHETNTPLSVIMSNIELFELDLGKHPNLSNIEAAMKNIYSIYDDLSYLIKKEQFTYPKKDIALVDYMRSRIEFFTVVANQANLTFDFEHSCAEIYLYINETKLQRIIDNNITNAIKYTKEDESIKVTLHGDKTHCIFEIFSYSSLIRDLKKVFEAYYREDLTKDGIGLGLNLVKQICDEEDIEILLTSNQDLTKFSYRFPKAKK